MKDTDIVMATIGITAVGVVKAVTAKVAAANVAVATAGSGVATRLEPSRSAS